MVRCPNNVVDIVYIYCTEPNWLKFQSSNLQKGSRLCMIAVVIMFLIGIFFDSRSQGSSEFIILIKNEFK